MRILYLDLDTLRPDHLGCYGYHRDTSPNIDWIASEGTRFDNYYASDAPCLPSRAALMSGRLGIHNGAIGHGGKNAELRPDGALRSFQDRLSRETLPAICKEAGLHTAYIGGFGERHSLWTFYAGFREIHDTGMGGMESAEDVTPTALEWIANNATRDNWYLQINYWDPHTPYRAPEDFGNPFENDPLPAWITEEKIQAHRRQPGPHGAQDIAMFSNAVNPRFPRHPGEVKDMRGMRTMIDGYDCGVRYMDGHIGELLNAFRKAGVLDDMAIIVSSDHGENLGEIGMYAEHGTADQITCRIPMIFRWPGGQKGRVDKGLHYNIDLAPTLAELFGIAPKPRWDGQSYAQTILTGADTGRSELVLSQCCHGCQRSVRFGPYLYIRTYHDFFHLFPREMLFNVELDPHEERDIANEAPDVVREAAYRLLNWQDKMMATMERPYTSDPLWEVIQEGGPFHARGNLPRYCERLKQSGRERHIAELKNRHPREFENA